MLEKVVSYTVYEGYQFFVNQELVFSTSFAERMLAHLAARTEDPFGVFFHPSAIEALHRHLVAVG